MRDVDEGAAVEDVLAVHDAGASQVLHGARRRLQGGLRQGEPGDIALVAPRVAVVVMVVVVVVVVLSRGEHLQTDRRQ